MNIETKKLTMEKTENAKESEASKPISLPERIYRIDPIQARRFAKLNGEALEIAATGIRRHLRACGRMNVIPDASAVREIIDDALDGRRVYAQTDQDRLHAA